MKKLLSITAIAFCSCIQHSAGVIEGIYTRESAGEFSKASDTLIFYIYDSARGTYLIWRKTGFIRIKEGVPQPKQWRDEKMITVYDENTNQLADKKTGRLFSFKTGELLFGTARYKKVGGQ